MNKLASLLLFLLMSVALVSTAEAATVTCAATGNWSAPATWVGGIAPTAADAVIVPGNLTVTIDVVNASCASLQLGSSVAGGGRGTITFNAGSQLTVTSPVTIGAANNTGSIIMASGGLLRCGGLLQNGLTTWTPGTGTVELTATNLLPNNGITTFNHLVVSGGTTTLNANTTVAGDFTIQAGGTVDCAVKNLTLTGNYINQGTFIGNAGSVIFNRNGNQSITGTGTNNFTAIRVNMGLSTANVLDVNCSNFSAPDAFLTLSNGTFKMSGTNTFTNTFFLPAFNISTNTGFWLNNPNVTMTAQTGGADLRGGLFHLSAGVCNIGVGVDDHFSYASGTILIDGGTLNVAGNLGRNAQGALVSYTQSGGTVRVMTQGSTDLVVAGFDIGQPASTFSMSGGTIIIANASSSPADFLNASSTSSVTGGTLQLGDASSANAQVLRIQSAPAIPALTLSNATAQAVKPAAQALTALTVVGGVTIPAGTTLNANSQPVSLTGNWSNEGSFTNGASVTFNGTGAQSIARTGGETFPNLVVNKSAGLLTLLNNTAVNNTLSLLSGTMAIGANTLTLNGAVAGTGLLSSGPAGVVDYHQSSPGQGVLAGNYSNLVFSDFSKTLPATGTVGVSGSFTPGAALTHTITGSTFDFNGASQTIPAFTYQNLTTSGSGTKTTSGTVTVSGSLTHNAGITLSSPGTLNLNGASHANHGTLNATTLSLGTGATLTNDALATVSSSLTGPGAFQQAGTGTLRLAGTADVTTLAVAAAGNTVEYTGVSQAVRPLAYQNLVLSGSGAPTLAGLSTVNGAFTVGGTVAAAAANSMTFGGDVSILSGASFGAGTFTHNLHGNWTNAGTFDAGTSTFTLDGAAPQSIGGSTFSSMLLNNAAGVSQTGDVTIGGALTLINGTYAIGAHSLHLNGALAIAGGTLSENSASSLVVGGTAAAITLPALTLGDFTLARAAGASLAGDMSVANALTVTSGTLTTSTHTVTLGPTATLSEQPGQTVLGNLTTTRTLSATTGTNTFGNLGADLTLNGVAPGITTVLRRTGVASTGAGHSSALRSFDITPTVNTGLNAALTLHYDNSELSGQNAALFEAFRSRDGGVTWNDLGGTSNTTARTVTVSGINDLSRWTVADTLNRIGSTAAPATVSISPALRTTGDPAFTLTVNGSEFVNGKSTVRLNGVTEPTTYVNSTQLTAAIPASALLSPGALPVTVFSATGGGLSNAQTLTVNPGVPVSVRIETAADGSGSVVGAQSLASGGTLTVFAVSRDALDHFVANVAATSWSLAGRTGGVLPGDLVPSPDAKSAVFSAHATGTAAIQATSGALTIVPSGTITVTAGAATQVRLESAANGTGAVVGAQSVLAGNSVSLFAVTRDAANNFVANVAASSWTLESVTGGVVAGDLVPAPDAKSATFTGHLLGSAVVRATSGALSSTPSGVLSVTAGAPVAVRVETAANGSGTVVAAQSIASGASVAAFAVTRDAQGNFVANVAASAWSLQNTTGGVVPTDLTPAPDSKSAVFTGHGAGSARISATSAALTATPSGILTVTPGVATQVRVETAANGTGTVVPAQSIPAGSAVTLFAISRDASNNFVANVAASGWTLESLTGGVVSGDLVAALDAKSAVFTAHLTGSAVARATVGALSSTPSGVLTAAAGTAVSVRVETAANGSGSLVSAQSLASGSALAAFAVTRDALGNFVANVAASSWSLLGSTGGVTAADLVPAVDARSAVFTAHVIGTTALSAASGALAATPSGTLTVIAGSASHIQVETAANGSGTVVPAQAVPTGASLTLFAITRDASNNFVANAAASAWGLESVTGGVTAGDLVPALDSRSAVFTAHLAGAAVVRASSGALASSPSGVLTASAGPAVAVRVETAANGTGTVVPSQAVPAGATVTAFAVSRDAAGNFVANVAATSWSLLNNTGGVVDGDLVAAPDLKSAVFTGHLLGSTTITLDAGALPVTSSGFLAVIPGAASVVRAETAANGTGSPVAAQSLAAGASLTLFSVTRDALGNFIANVAAGAWSLESATGGIVAADLLPAADRKSAVLTGHVVGSAAVRATSGALASVASGTITVVAGAPVTVRVETSATGGGSLLAAQTLSVGASVTGFAITRDAFGNFVANVAASDWSLQGTTGGIVAGDLVVAPDARSATLTGHAPGTTALRATSGALVAVNSGVLTYTATTGLGDGPLPLAFVLGPNVPNPFRPATQLHFELPVASEVELTVYDAMGRVVETLARGHFEAGRHLARWDAGARNAGVYFARLRVTDETGHTRFSHMEKLTLMK